MKKIQTYYLFNETVDGLKLQKKANELIDKVTSENFSNFVIFLNDYLSEGYNVNLRNQYGATALMFSCIHENYKKSKLLLDKGADPNISNTSGYNALYYVMRNGYSDERTKKKMGSLLLDYNADVINKNMNLFDYLKKEPELYDYFKEKYPLKYQEYIKDLKIKDFNL